MRVFLPFLFLDEMHQNVLFSKFYRNLKETGDSSCILGTISTGSVNSFGQRCFWSCHFNENDLSILNHTVGG